uniref:acetyl-CoA acetyltransferase n=1 Tax=Henriciella sp. TaxID=1968823 RepID=UPI002624D2D4
MAKGSMPVLVGVGQAMSQWDGKNGPEGAPSPLSLAHNASQNALKDASVDASEIDAITFVRIFEDSVPNAPHPHGHNTNLPGTLARDLKADAKTLIYSDVGGQSPQALANEMAARIHDGEFDVALVAGSEANRASKGALKNGVEINWADESHLDYEDRGLGGRMLSRAEAKHGLVAPAFFYALFENAIAAREGRTKSGQRQAMAELFHPFTKVAADNPYSQFPTERSVDFLKTPSPENYEFADPFLKWHIAQDAVNQGAAMLLMSEEKADELGVAKDKRVYLHGGGEASDDLISERPKLDGSWAMEEAISRALDQAGKTSGGMTYFDIYSCFPCAVFSAAQGLNIDPFNDERALTQTGGLPFFGGPGNN